MRPLLAFLAALPLLAQTDSDLEKKITDMLKSSGVPSVSVAVVQDGKVGFVKAFGKATADAPSTVDTRYPIGSISKQFTSVALLLAQERGQLSLDDKVSKYFPDLTRAGDVTIRQLLSHTSGYEDYAPQDYIIPEWTRPVTPDEILQKWAKKPLNFEPGAKWQYSNTNYVLAAKIFEKATAAELVPYLKEHVFTPLHMDSAGDCATHGNDASAFTRYAGGAARPVAREANGWYFGAAQLCMSARDVATWDAAFLHGQILSARSYQELTRETKLINGDNTHYGLGVSTGEFNSIPTISHNGEVSGFLASNTLYPTRNAAIVVLTNQDGVNFMGPLTSALATILFKLPEPPAVKATDTEQVRTILKSLAKGKLDRPIFTANANSYFTAQALADIRLSISRYGNLQTLTRTNETLRGGMTHRTYRAVFAKKSVNLNIYVMPDGKYEQFLIME